MAADALRAVLDGARTLLCTASCCRRSHSVAGLSSFVEPLLDADKSSEHANANTEAAAENLVGEHGDVNIEDLRTAALMHHTSVALIPPDEVWPAIQAARTLVRDRGLWRWPPHANLLYPFVAPQHFYAAAHELAAATASVAPFDLTLSDFRVFVHSKRSATLWLHPEPSRPDALVELQAALQAAVPQANTQTSAHGGVFTAHFTIGHFAGEAAALAARDAILAYADLWPPAGITFRVDAAVLMARDGPDGQFEPRWRVRLGQPEPGSALAPVGPLPRGEAFTLMPSQMPDFCVREKSGSRGWRRRGRSRRQPAEGAIGVAEGEIAMTADNGTATAANGGR